jgi:hypothetical protein
LEIEDLLIMKQQLGKQFINQRLDTSRILGLKDAKTIKMLRSRIASLISIKSSNMLKSLSYLKFKTALKMGFESKFKEINDR